MRPLLCLIALMGVSVLAAWGDTGVAWFLRAFPILAFGILGYLAGR